jgi:hypothetical protein
MSLVEYGNVKRYGQVLQYSQLALSLRRLLAIVFAQEMSSKNPACKYTKIVRVSWIPRAGDLLVMPISLISGQISTIGELEIKVPTRLKKLQFYRLIYSRKPRKEKLCRWSAS